MPRVVCPINRAYRRYGEVAADYLSTAYHLILKLTISRSEVSASPVKKKLHK